MLKGQLDQINIKGLSTTYKKSVMIISSAMAVCQFIDDSLNAEGAVYNEKVKSEFEGLYNDTKSYFAAVAKYEDEKLPERELQEYETDDPATLQCLLDSIDYLGKYWDDPQYEEFKGRIMSSLQPLYDKFDSAMNENEEEI